MRSHEDAGYLTSVTGQGSSLDNYFAQNIKLTNKLAGVDLKFYFFALLLHVSCLFWFLVVCLYFL